MIGTTTGEVTRESGNGGRHPRSTSSILEKNDIPEYNPTVTHQSFGGETELRSEVDSRTESAPVSLAPRSE